MSRLELHSNPESVFQVPTFSAPTDGEGNAELSSVDLTSYQCSEMSIVPGMSTSELLSRHRQTLSHLNPCAKETEGGRLHSITLSRRHFFPPELYKRMVIKGYSETLESYSFGPNDEVGSAKSG